MNNLISWYNQNRRKFWSVIITVIVISMILWRLINSLNFSSNTSLNVEKTQVDTNTLNTISLAGEKSAITGARTTISQDEVNLIDQFFSYCNSGKIQEAYNLISDDCKNEMYSEIKIFQEAYFNPVFGNGKKNISIEKWTGKIYMVKIHEDFLATGRYSDDNTIQDYVTVVKDNAGKLKLNINNYVGRTIYGKTSNAKDLEIKLLRKDTYMDYETYTFEIKNNAEYTILLGDIQDEENVSYLIDKNNLKYNAYVHELAESQMEILGKQVKNITIKYFSEYVSTKKIESLVFPKICLNYELYNLLENKNNYSNYVNIRFEL